MGGSPTGEIMAKTVKEYTDEWIKDFIEKNKGKDRRHPNGTPMCFYPACVKPDGHDGEHTMG